MAATMIIYNSFVDRVVRNLTDPDSGLTVKAMLLTASYTPSQTHDFRDDLTNEVTGTGYSAGGATVTVTVVKVDASNLTRITFGPAVWNAAGGGWNWRQRGQEGQRWAECACALSPCPSRAARCCCPCSGASTPH